MKKSRTKKEKLKTPKQDKTEEAKSPPTSQVKSHIGKEQARHPALSIFNLYPLILILLVGILSYSNTLHGPFVFDDAYFILDRKEIHLESLSPASLTKLGQTLLEKGRDNGRPVSTFSFALNYYFGGLNTFGYHLVNLLIHLTTAILVYLFLKLTLSLPSLEERYRQHVQEIALLSSLLFVAHPIQTQAVSYIFQRVAVMATLFFLLALYCYGKARLAGGKKRKAFFAGTALAALLAFGSKENAITLPFFIALYEYYFWQRLELGQNKKKWLYTILGLFLVAVLLGLIYTQFDPMHWLNKKYQIRAFTPGQRMLTQLRVVVYYISLLFYPLPSRLNLDYNFPLSYSLLNPPTTLICLGLILGLIISSIYLAKKRPLISFALLWFWGNLVMESSFLPLEMVYEHRLYLPSVGFFLLFSILLVKGVDKFKTDARVMAGIKAGLLLAMLVPLSIMTYQRNKVWQDKLTLYEDAISKSPGKARLHYNMGNTYANRNLLAEAIAQYQRSLEIKPGFKRAHNNLGTIYLQQGKYEQAIAEFLEEIKLNPNNAAAYYNLGNTYREQGLLAEAAAQYQRSLEIDPGFVSAHYNLGITYSIKKLFQLAEQEYLAVLKLKPGHAKAHKKLGGIYLNTGNSAKAVSHFEKSLALAPQQPQTSQMRKFIKEQQKHFSP